MIEPTAVPVIRRDQEVQVFQNGFGRLYDDEVTGPTGKPGRYLRWQWSHPSIVVVPFDGDHVPVWSMFRYPVGLTLLEFPRGGRLEQESIDAAARRELLEETGLTGGRTKHLGRVYPDSGIIDGFADVVAVEVHRENSGHHAQEAMESIHPEAVWLTAGEMTNAIASGSIRCGVTLAAWALFCAGKDTRASR